MTLQIFNVFGQVRISKDKIEISYSAGKPLNFKLAFDEQSPEIKGDAVGECLFGMLVSSDNLQTLYYVTQEIPGVEIEELPVVEKYMDIIAGSIRQLDRTSQ